MNSPASGWHRDPTARHEYRYWDGARWTDDVSDRGVTTTDPMPGGEPGASGSDPTEVIDATQAYPTAPGAPPTAQQPGAFGPYGTLPPQTGGYGSYGSGGMPPATPQKKGPNTPLLIGLGLLALVAVVVAVVLITGGDDDDGSETADDPLSDVELPDSSSGDEPTDSGDSGDPGGSSDTSDVPDDSGDLGGGEIDPSDIPTDVITDVVVEQLVASGEYTEEQARCITERMFEELSVEELAEIGESGDMSSITPEEMSGLAEVMEECVG